MFAYSTFLASITESLGKIFHDQWHGCCFHVGLQFLPNTRANVGNRKPTRKSRARVFLLDYLDRVFSLIALAISILVILTILKARKNYPRIKKQAQKHSSHLHVDQFEPKLTVLFHVLFELHNWVCAHCRWYRFNQILTKEHWEVFPS